MKKTLIAAAALVAMVGCNKSLIESPAVDANEFGTINLGVSASTEMVVTKAVTTEADLTDYEITLKKDGTVKWTKTYTEVSADESLWKVPAGNYSVLVENVTVDEVYDETHTKGQVRVSGEEDVVVYPGIASPCEVNCTPKNSKVSFLYTEAFKNVFDVEDEATAVTVTDGTKNFTMKMSEAVEGLDKAALDAAFYEPSELTWELKIKNGKGELKTYTSKVTTKIATWTHVTFNTGDVNGTINVTITVNDKIENVENLTATLDPVTDGNVDTEAQN